MIARLETLQAKENAGRLPLGATQFLKSVGAISNDGQWIKVTVEQWISTMIPQPSQKTGLGDLVHKVAGPIGQAIHWPCNERDSQGNVTTNLRPNSPCAKAREMLNKVKI